MSKPSWHQPSLAQISRTTQLTYKQKKKNVLVHACYKALLGQWMTDIFIEQIFLPCLAPDVAHHQSRSLLEVVSRPQNSEYHSAFKTGQSTDPPAVSDGAGGTCPPADQVAHVTGRMEEPTHKALPEHLRLAKAWARMLNSVWGIKPHTSLFWTSNFFFLHN